MKQKNNKNERININERENTKVHNLKRSMEFPVYEYLKYNGYLGLQGVHNGELIYASKTTLLIG